MCYDIRIANNYILGIKKQQIIYLLFFVLLFFSLCLYILVNNLAIRKNPNIPQLNLIIDENITELSLETKLESFLDIMRGEYHG